MSKTNKFPFKDYINNYSEYQLNQLSNSILKMLIQPFTDYDAYDLGIIDNKGNELIPYNSVPRHQKRYYCRLVRICIMLKKIINKYPKERLKFRTYYIALQSVDKLMENEEFDIDSFEEEISVSTYAVDNPILPLRRDKNAIY